MQTLTATYYKVGILTASSVEVRYPWIAQAQHKFPGNEERPCLLARTRPWPSKFASPMRYDTLLERWIASLIDGQLTRLFAVDEAVRSTAGKVAAADDAAAVDKTARWVLQLIRL